MGYRNCLFQFYYKITKNEESSGSSIWGQFSWQPFSWQHCSLGASSNGSCWDLSAWPASGERRAEDLPANMLPAAIANCVIFPLKCNTSEAVLTTTSRQNHPRLIYLLLYCPLKEMQVAQVAYNRWLWDSNHPFLHSIQVWSRLANYPINLYLKIQLLQLWVTE